ncbi:MAG: ATP-dependent DNA helicase RecQ [Akkermansia sp.]
MNEFEVMRDPLKALEKFFGFSKLREGQDQVIHSILDGNDTLVVMPTGGGKSLCYQLPALCREGITFVVSPLIALMKDQVDALEQRGIPATMINSSLGQTEQRDRIQRMKAGEFKLVYIAPERFGQPGFMRALTDLDIELIAVDEAHCLSQWGHDFRPDYLRLGSAIETMGSPQVIALTATATAKVRADIAQHLHLRNPKIIVRGFARENLRFRISPCDGNKDKFARLHALIRQYKTGIVYCTTRKKVEQVSEELTNLGLNVVAYHAGMSDDAREKAQDLFISQKADIAVATNAFGMGIDRADVRFVAHFEVPGSVEAFYQEAGRAGRDGGEACCELLFNHADLRTQEFFIDGVNPSFAMIVDLYEKIRQYCDAETKELLWSHKEMAERLELKNEMAVGAALAVLSRTGAIERFDVPGQRIKGTRVLHPDWGGQHLNLDAGQLLEKERRDREKLKAITEFAYSSGCRQQWILQYFGEDDSAPCGQCDQCLSLGQAETSALGEDEINIVKKALSGVARASSRLSNGQWEAHWGKLKIIQMLKGSRSQDILKTSLSRLSTYGILADLSEDAIKQIFQALKLAGYIKTQGADRPVLTLTDKGTDAMLGKSPIHLVWPLSHSSTPASASAFSRFSSNSAHSESSNKMPKALFKHAETVFGEFDEILFENLKKLRTEIARDEHVIPYQVFHNSVLEALARLKPTTREGAMNIHGIGNKKADRYLTEFLDIIAEHEGMSSDNP